MAANFTSKDQMVKVEHSDSSAPKRAYATPIAERYVAERKEKAEKQGAKFSQKDWNEMKAYKYTIL